MGSVSLLGYGMPTRRIALCEPRAVRARYPFGSARWPIWRNQVRDGGTVLPRCVARWMVHKEHRESTSVSEPTSGVDMSKAKRKDSTLDPEKGLQSKAEDHHTSGNRR